MADRWTTEQMPDLADRVVIVTGANSGIGREAAREFARRDATVILACRNMERGEQCGSDIAADVGGASLDLRQLDLADLESVDEFADGVLTDYSRLDILCNNAGLMAIPRRETSDGFEMQLGVNHLGHFALTGRLLELILETPSSRVVTVSSNAHKFGEIRFEDLHWERGYSKWGAYGQSKLANLHFAFELQRRFDHFGHDSISVGCHPGMAHTNLAEKGPLMSGRKLMAKASNLFTKTFGQSAKKGALPVLYAAVESRLEGAEYVGPDGFAEAQGYPEITEPDEEARDEEVARRLWDVSEGLTGVYYDFEGAQ